MSKEKQVSWIDKGEDVKRMQMALKLKAGTEEARMSHLNTEETEWLVSVESSGS